jgi:hypothetical protein
MKPIIFFNTFHNGDIHVSREFIKDILTKITNSVEYHHNCPHKLLSDINITQKGITPGYYYDNFQIIYEKNDIIYINTWYNPNFNAFKLYGCTLKTLYENFKTIYQYLGIKIEDFSFYIPSFNFTSFNVEPIGTFLNNDTRKKIFISNGPVQSGQSANFDFNTIIQPLITNFPNILFIISNESILSANNLYNTKSIINSNECDLCENAYITTLCDMIIGRCSGTFSFALIKDNLISEKKQTWVGICNIDPKFGVDEFLHPNKTFHWMNYFDTSRIYNDLKSIIENL